MARVTVRFNDGHNQVLKRIMAMLKINKSEAIKFCINYTNASLTTKTGIVIAADLKEAAEKTLKEK